MFCLAASIVSCSDPFEAGETNEGQGAEFSQASFDGCWQWFEDGEAVHDIIIEDGEIASLAPANARAQMSAHTTKNCTISPQDGLIALSYSDKEPAGGLEQFTTFRFDLSDSRTVSAHNALAMGVIPGEKVVDLSDPEDILMLPPTDVRQGQLVRCDSK